MRPNRSGMRCWRSTRRRRRRRRVPIINPLDDFAFLRQLAVICNYARAYRSVREPDLLAVSIDLIRSGPGIRGGRRTSGRSIFGLSSSGPDNRGEEMDFLLGLPQPDSQPGSLVIVSGHRANSASGISPSSGFGNTGRHCRPLD